MIEIMKTCHQEIEVTDMTGLKPSNGEPISYERSTTFGGMGGGMAMASSESRSMPRGGAMMSAAMPSGSVGMCAMASASPAMSSELDDMERRLAMLDMCDSMPKEKAKNYESESRDVFRGEAVMQLKGTVMKKQAKVRSAKMMI